MSTTAGRGGRSRTGLHISRFVLLPSMELAESGETYVISVEYTEMVARFVSPFQESADIEQAVGSFIDVNNNSYVYIFTRGVRGLCPCMIQNRLKRVTPSWILTELLLGPKALLALHCPVLVDFAESLKFPRLPCLYFRPGRDSPAAFAQSL